MDEKTLEHVYELYGMMGEYFALALVPAAIILGGGALLMRNDKESGIMVTRAVFALALYVLALGYLALDVVFAYATYYGIVNGWNFRPFPTWTTGANPIVFGVQVAYISFLYGFPLLYMYWAHRVIRRVVPRWHH